MSRVCARATITLCRREALKAAGELNMDLVEVKAPLHGVGGSAQEMPVAQVVSYAALREAQHLPTAAATTATAAAIHYRAPRNR